MTDKKQSPQKALHIHRLKKLSGEYFAQLNQITCKESWPYIIIIVLPFFSELKCTSLAHFQQAALL